MDKPIGPPEPAAGCHGAGTWESAGRRPHGDMGGRRVSEASQQARRLPLSVREQAGAIAGAVGAHQGLRSRPAIAGAPIARSAATRPHPAVTGGAEGPTQPAEQAVDFLTTYQRLRSFRERHSIRAGSEIGDSFFQTTDKIAKYVRIRFRNFNRNADLVFHHNWMNTIPEQSYRHLQVLARQAEADRDIARASAIREALNEIDRHAAKNLRMLTRRHGPAEPSFLRAPQRASAAAAPQPDWCRTYRQLLGIRYYFRRAGRLEDAKKFMASVTRMENHVRQRFKKFHGKQEQLLPRNYGSASGSEQTTRPEQMYRILEDMAHGAEAARGAGKLPEICESVETMNEFALEEMRLLTSGYGPLENLAVQAGLSGQQAPERAGTGAAAVPPAADPFPESPGPSSRVMPAPAAPTPTAPAPASPLAQREAIVERFRSSEALFQAGFRLGSGGADTLGWDDGRADIVLADLHQLNRSAAKDPAAATALPGIDWSGIEALMGILDVPPASPSS